MSSAPISGERTWEMFDPPPERAKVGTGKTLAYVNIYYFTVSNNVTQAFATTSYKNSCRFDWKRIVMEAY